MGTKTKIKFSVNGIPVLARNDDGEWLNIFEDKLKVLDVKTIEKTEEEKNKSLIETAATVNKTLNRLKD